MAKKVKFLLKMADEAQVRSLEELREHFDLASVLGYYDDGRLIEWLTDRYYEAEAEKVKALDPKASDFKKYLCDILDAPYSEDKADGVDLAEISARNERLKRLKEFTSDDKILAAMDSVAYTQEELDKLLDKDIKEIYLCGERFKIKSPPGLRIYKNVIIIGVNNPKVDIPDGYAAKGITFQNVDLDIDDIIRKAKESTDPVEAVRLLRRATEQGNAEAQYRLGVCYYNGKGVEQDYIEAIKWIRKAAEQNYAPAQKAFTHNGKRFNNFQMCISSYSGSTVGLKKDGTVVAVGFNIHGQCNTQDWRDIIAFSVGSCHTVGLKKDGTVVAAGANPCGECDTQSWRDIIAILASENYTVGLKKDGTVVAVGRNDVGQCNTQSWHDIVAFSVSSFHTVGLKKDGTVVAVGRSKDGQCNTQDWRDIIAISAGGQHTVGLKKDGTVVSSGKTPNVNCNTKDWFDIIAVFAKGLHTVGWKKDGTIVSSINIQGWRDITAVSVYDNHIIGLKKDGTVVATTLYNDYGQCNTQGWRDIVAVSTGYDYTVGLKKDGTLVAVGRNENGQCNIQGWRDIGLVLNEADFAK
jgi:TPR repeat protein